MEISLGQPVLPTSSTIVESPLRKPVDEQTWLKFFSDIEEMQLDRQEQPLSSIRDRFKYPFDEKSDLMSLQKLLERVQPHWMGSIDPIHSSLAEGFYRRGDLKEAFIAARRLSDCIERDEFYIKIVETAHLADEISLGVAFFIVEDYMNKTPEDFRLYSYAKIIEGFLRLGHLQALEVAKSILTNRLSYASPEIKDPLYAALAERYLERGNKEAASVCVLMSRDNPLRQELLERAKG